MRRLLYYILFLLFMTLHSCVSDSGIDSLPEPEEEEMLNINVRINTSPTTYSIGNPAENKIKNVDVLAFKITEGVPMFSYRVKVDDIRDGSTNNEKHFVFKAKKTKYQYYFVFIANSRDAIDGIEPIPTWESKNSILPNIVNSKASWNLSTDAIPMWGETKDPISIYEGQIITGIKMLRELARVDVLVNSSVGNFSLKEVYLYNYSTKGRVTPKELYWKWDDLRVINASLPADCARQFGPLEYLNITNNRFEEKLYTFETPQVDQGEDLIATCLVVGGLYEQDNKETYYRIDFSHLVRDDEAGGSTGPPGSGGGSGGGVGMKKQFFPLLRNHIHEIRITSVSKRGEDNKEDAFYNKTEGMDVEIQNWNMNNVMAEIGGQYTLKLSTGSLDIKPGVTDYITVESNNPLPWTITIDPSSPWIQAVKKDNKTIEVNVTGTGLGEGYIDLKVGNITKRIKVNRITG